MSAGRGCAVLIVISMLVAVPRAQEAPPAGAAKADPRVDRLKTEAAAAVDGMAVFTQQMVDQIFSYGELGFQEQETHRYLVDILKKNGFSGGGRHRRHPDRVHGDVGLRQAGDRARIRHRRDSAGVAEAGRRVSRSADRGRARPRRRAQLRAGAEHHRGDRGEEDHGAREAAGHDSDLAGHGRGAPRHQGATSCAPDSSRTSTSPCSRTSDSELAVSWGERSGTGLVSVEYSFRGETAHRRAPRGAGGARSMPSS